MNILVTGGSSGIGKAIVKRFAVVKEIDNVFTCGLHYDGSSFGFQIQSVERKIHYKRVDVTANEFYGYLCNLDPYRIDVLVNNAGTWKDDLILNLEIIDEMMDWYVKRLKKELINKSPDFKVGRIINIASLAGHEGCPDNPMYGACKAGVINLTKSYANKYSDVVRTVSISPGFVNNTKLVEGKIPKHLINKIPLKRPANPEEIAELVYRVYNLDYLTGVDIIIDGGLSTN